jgi:hypothetical protein
MNMNSGASALPVRGEQQKQAASPTFAFGHVECVQPVARSLDPESSAALPQGRGSPSLPGIHRVTFPGRARPGGAR